MEHRVAKTVEMLVRGVTWMALLFAQVLVVGMSINALYPRGSGGDRSALEGRLWALCLPFLFAASVVVVMWKEPPRWMSDLGGLYCLICGILVILGTGGLLFN